MRDDVIFQQMSFRKSYPG